MPIETLPWDSTEHLQSEEDQIAYIEAVFEDGDMDLIIYAIGNVAKVRGVGALAEGSGLTRAALYKSFRRGGNPTLSTVTKVLKVLGLKLSVSAA